MRRGGRRQSWKRRRLPRNPLLFFVTISTPPRCQCCYCFTIPFRGKQNKFDSFGFQTQQIYLSPLILLFVFVIHCVGTVKSGTLLNNMKRRKAFPGSCWYTDQAHACQDWSRSCWKVGFAFEPSPGSERASRKVLAASLSLDTWYCGVSHGRLSYGMVWYDGDMVWWWYDIVWYGMGWHLVLYGISW